MADTDSLDLSSQLPSWLLNEEQTETNRIVGSEEARREALASVRRPNCTYGFPVLSNI
jgi:hypothetical protein